jgi:hypothetical protein
VKGVVRTRRRVTAVRGIRTPQERPVVVCRSVRSVVVVSRKVWRGTVAWKLRRGRRERSNGGRRRRGAENDIADCCSYVVAWWRGGVVEEVGEVWIELRLCG